MSLNEIIRTWQLPGERRLDIIRGDLLEEHVDAIVNAANSLLEHGGGVAGAIVRRGGSIIQEESRAWVRQHGPVKPGEPAYTSAGSLPFRYIIHAVGPIWGEGDEDRKLADAVSGALNRAGSLGVHSLALPAISTGIFGFPAERASRVILKAILDHFRNDCHCSLEEVRLVLLDRRVLSTFLDAMDELE